MTAYYCDTSALVKRYADESGSAWVRQITEPSSHHTILLAEITLAELATALSAKHRAPKGMTKEQRDHVLSRFLQDCAENYVLLQIDRTVIDRAVELTQNHRLRGYDAVQLATALVASEVLHSQSLSQLVFVASDTDLLSAASAEQLPTENPVQHTGEDTPEAPPDQEE